MHGKYEMNNNLMVCNNRSHITKFNNDYDQYHHSCKQIKMSNSIFKDYVFRLSTSTWSFRQLQPFVVAIFLSYIHEKNT